MCIDRINECVVCNQSIFMKLWRNDKEYKVCYCCGFETEVKE